MSCIENIGFEVSFLNYINVGDLFTPDIQNNIVKASKDIVECLIEVTQQALSPTSVKIPSTAIYLSNTTFLVTNGDYTYPCGNHFVINIEQGLTIIDMNASIIARNDNNIIIHLSLLTNNPNYDIIYLNYLLSISKDLTSYFTLYNYVSPALDMFTGFYMYSFQNVEQIPNYLFTRITKYFGILCVPHIPNLNDFQQGNLTLDIYFVSRTSKSFVGSFELPICYTPSSIKIVVDPKAENLFVIAYAPNKTPSTPTYAFITIYRFSLE